MIRRLFWLAAGALLGVTGYRRASRLVRSMRPGEILARQSWAVIRPGGPAGRSGRPAARRGTGERRGVSERSGIGLFARDVRDGMELYLDRHSDLDRHSGQPGPAPGGQQVAARLAGQAGVTGSYPETDNYPDIDNAKDGR